MAILQPLVNITITLLILGILTSSSSFAYSYLLPLQFIPTSLLFLPVILVIPTSLRKQCLLENISRTKHNNVYFNNNNTNVYMICILPAVSLDGYNNGNRVSTLINDIIIDIIDVNVCLIRLLLYC